MSASIFLEKSQFDTKFHKCSRNLKVLLHQKLSEEYQRGKRGVPQEKVNANMLGHHNMLSSINALSLSLSFSSSFPLR